MFLFRPRLDFARLTFLPSFFCRRVSLSHKVPHGKAEFYLYNQHILLTGMREMLVLMINFIEIAIQSILSMTLSAAPVLLFFGPLPLSFT